MTIHIITYYNDTVNIKFISILEINDIYNTKERRERLKVWLDSTDIDFGTRLKNRIKNCGYTQSAFAEKIGVSKSTLVKYINGSIDLPLSVFIEICDLLSTPYDYMLDGNTPLNPAFRSVYGLLVSMGYDIQTNPKDENEIAINYHGETVFLNYEDIKEKILTFTDFLLYQKTK